MRRPQELFSGNSDVKYIQDEVKTAVKASYLEPQFQRQPKSRNVGLERLQLSFSHALFHVFAIITVNIHHRFLCA